MKDKNLEQGEISGFLDDGTDFEGKLMFRDTMRIDGKFHGKIKSSSVLIVGETAQIDGEIKVSRVSINGSVSGKIIADKKVEIHSKGRVYCDIKTPKLVIEDGAFFQGNCNMDSGKTKQQGELIQTSAEKKSKVPAPASAPASATAEKISKG